MSFYVPRDYEPACNQVSGTYQPSIPKALWPAVGPLEMLRGTGIFSPFTWLDTPKQGWTPCNIYTTDILLQTVKGEKKIKLMYDSNPDHLLNSSSGHTHYTKDG